MLPHLPHDAAVQNRRELGEAFLGAGNTGFGCDNTTRNPHVLRRDRSIIAAIDVLASMPTYII
jgi:hypothetical protein